jgi:hypothetical protein
LSLRIAKNFAETFVPLVPRRGAAGGGLSRRATRSSGAASVERPAQQLFGRVAPFGPRVDLDGGAGPGALGERRPESNAEGNGPY